MKFILQVCIPMLCFFACSNKQPVQDSAAGNTTATNTVGASPVKDNFVKGKIITPIACKGDATQSYALYIPIAKDNALMPVIYCFDPHADGALPLKNYQALADAFHFILVGSNNSKNGNDWSITQVIWNSLRDDTRSRLPIDTSRMYTCGFSGGAKVAGFIALHQSNIKGVIAAGAGLPEDASYTNFVFSFTGMAGRGDMNMTDLVALNSELDKTSIQHRLILFDGKHAWPPTTAMRIAFAGLQLDAMRARLIDKNDSLIQAFNNDMLQQITKDKEAKKAVAAQQDCELAIQMFKGIDAAALQRFEATNKMVTGSPLYQEQLQVSQQLFATEQKEKQLFQQQFQQGDRQYWTTTINDLQTKAKASTEEGAMYQRLLAYLSLAFYSISNNLINNNQNEAAQHFVTLYKMADATNPEAWYFSALLNARSNNATAAEADLLKAADNGFTDTTRLLQQPEFQSLASQINIAQIESRMKKAE